MPYALGLGLVLAYIAAVAFVFFKLSAHTDVGLLVAQYVFLLPGVVLWLKKGRGGASAATIPVAASAGLYVVCAALLLAAPGRLGVSSSGDESAYRFQANILRSGHVTVAAPARTAENAPYYTDAFRIHHHIIKDGRWFGKYPPGWPAVLAIAGLARAGWLLNPIFGILLLYLTWRIGLEFMGRDVATVAVFLMAASPYFVLNVIGYMSHPWCAVLLAGSGYFTLRVIRDARLRDFWIACVLLAASGLVRPYTALCVGFVLMGAALYRFRHDRLAAKAVLAMTVVGAGAAFILLAYNRALTGEWLRSTYAVYSGTQSVTELTFDPMRVLKNLPLLTRWSLQGTDIVCFPFLYLLALYGVFRGSSRSVPMLMLACFAALVAGNTVHALPSASRFGERDFFEGFAGLALAAAYGWKELRARWKPSAQAVTAVVLVLAGAQVMHFGVFFSERIASDRQLALIYSTIDAQESPNSVIFLKPDSRWSVRDLILHAADWQNRPAFVAVDPGPGWRASCARSLDRTHIVLIEMEGDTPKAKVLDTLR